MWAELELIGSLFPKWDPPPLVTSYSPRYRGATKQGKTAVCPRFTSNSLLAGFLCLEPGWGCPSPGCPSSPQPPRLASWSFWDAPWLKASIFLERLLLWLPARPLVSREISFFPREVLGSSCCQRVETCSAFSPWKTPGCGPASPAALAPS